MFQDGYISQSIDTVTAQGVTYFSAAGNQGQQRLSFKFGAASGTISAIGTGTFMNFNPNGGTILELPITTGTQRQDSLTQYDQPYNLQEPAGRYDVVYVHGQFLPAR